MDSLAAALRDHGRSVGTVATWLMSYVDANWLTIWDARLPRITEVYQSAGEPAYGVFGVELYRPAQPVLRSAGLACRPRLPGTLPLSEEHWGPEHHRERRMWCLLDDGAGCLGALVTRFFHDHTQLRIPSPPRVVGLPHTDHGAVRDAVLADWP